MSRPATPRGFRDVLPQEAAEREAITGAVSAAMAAWGYGRVETAVVEEWETLSSGAGTSLEGDVFRLFDSDGRLLALRPEMTVPIARLAATRLEISDVPQRLRYVSEVFREQASMRGQARQFTQAGLELIGEGGAAADAEVITVLAEALTSAGLAEFTIGMGTVSVWQALLERSGMDREWSEALLAAAHDRNIVGIDELAKVEGVPAEVREALVAVPRIRGGAEAIAECREVLGRAGVSDALSTMEETWQLLSESVRSRVQADFGVMRSFDYYTGLVLEVYAPDLGLPLGGGGRYDGLLGKFGRPAPAAGFAIGVERLHIALDAQGGESAIRQIDVVVGGEASAAFDAAAKLRAEGLVVTIAAGRDADGVEAAREAVGAREGLVAPLETPSGGDVR